MTAKQKQMYNKIDLLLWLLLSGFSLIFFQLYEKFAQQKCCSCFIFFFCIFVKTTTFCSVCLKCLVAVPFPLCVRVLVSCLDTFRWQFPARLFQLACCFCISLCFFIFVIFHSFSLVSPTCATK